MVKAGCVVFLLLSSTLMLCCVTAFHPVGKSLSAKPPEMLQKDPDEGTLENDNNLVKYFNENQATDDGGLEELKRAYGKNYLRFGRGDNPLLSALYIPDDATEEEKRASRNFLRFGRANQRNFLRFGKNSPMEFGLGIEPETPEEEIFKRGSDKNFLRFGKASDRNFLRFGRSIDSQMKNVCKTCLKKEELTSETSPLTRKRKMQMASGDQDLLSTTSKNRPKRSVSAFYDELMSMPQSPLAWSTQYGTYLPEPLPNNVHNQGTSQELQKRSHSRSFLRYGRDPLDLHFLRFGKRGPIEDTKSQENNDEDEFSRYIRARSPNNFIRFG